MFQIKAKYAKIYVSCSIIVCTRQFEIVLLVIPLFLSLFIALYLFFDSIVK